MEHSENARNNIVFVRLIIKLHTINKLGINSAFSNRTCTPTVLSKYGILQNFASGLNTYNQWIG
jgi:hypothetical protein